MLKKYDQVFSGNKYPIKKISDSNSEYERGCEKIKFSADDDIPLNKMIYFQTITVIIRCVFEKDVIYYPLVYLVDYLYQV